MMNPIIFAGLEYYPQLAFRKKALNTTKGLDADLDVLKKVAESVCEHYKISIEELRAKFRARELVDARAIYAYICKKYTDEKVMAIGKFISKNHATIIYHSNRFEFLMKYNKELKTDFENILDSFKSK